MTTRWVCYSMMLVLFLFVGCVEEEKIETGPPEGWQADGEYWWHADFDTTGAFRNLETLVDMGVTGAEATYLASPNMARSRSTQRRMFERAVKQELIRLYRNNPEVVDSLVERHVMPMMDEVNFNANLQAEAQKFKQKSYKFLHKNYFQAPQQKLQIGRDIEIPYPNELRERGVAGSVQVQIYVNEEGEPLSIELLEGVDPTLDGIAMRTMTQMRWRPAYTMGKGRWSAIPAWTRLSITFRDSG